MLCGIALGKLAQKTNCQLVHSIIFLQPSRKKKSGD